MNEKRKLDKTSIIMMSVFVLIIVAAVILVCAKLINDDAQNVSEDVTVLDETAVQEQEEAEEPELKFENYVDLTDKFMECCKNGDVESLYGLYYDDGLTKMRLNMAEAVDKETFDKNIKTEMSRITGFDEYEYGCPELPPTSSPETYASYIYYQANNQKELQLNGAYVENCVNLVVYIDGGYQTNHFMIQVDGLWYFLV